MRRQTVQKPIQRPASRRERELREEAARPRPEIRRDIHRTWWPDG
ncbi:hypothetical protein [Streptomyces triticagri]|nr:hypothetical protein [Streptomyces triticagri]